MADIVIPPLITLPFSHESTVSPHDSAEDKYPDSLPAYFIKNFSKKGARVFDPFIGHGTTALVAEKLGRIPYGIEADRDRYEWCAGQLEHWQNIHHADSADMADLGLPKMDFCITSPPFMARQHKWNPLSGGNPEYSGYDTYLEMLCDIFAQMKPVMKRGALVCVHVDNVRIGKIYTPLVRDFSICIGQSFTPVGESIISWKNREEPSHVLVFKAGA